MDDKHYTINLDQATMFMKRLICEPTPDPLSPAEIKDAMEFLKTIGEIGLQDPNLLEPTCNHLGRAALVYLGTRITSEVISGKLLGRMSEGD